MRRISVLVGVYVALLVAAVLFEKKLIYFPAREVEITPRDLGLQFDDLHLKASDGMSVHGWFLPVSDSRFTVLLCHGNAGNISHRLDRVLFMHAQLTTDVLLFDYRGYGLSDGSPDEEGTYRDARAAYRYLTEARGLDPERIVLFGESLGAAVALQLAIEEPAAGLVLEAPFASIPDMARAAYPFLPVGGWIRTRYDNVSKAPSLRIPLMVFHGRRDESVPFEQGRRVFEAAPEPKSFVPIAEAGHNDTYVVGAARYWAAWREFLAKL